MSRQKGFVAHNRGKGAQLAWINAHAAYKGDREIGAMFGISYQHVSYIQNGKLKRQRVA